MSDTLETAVWSFTRITHISEKITICQSAVARPVAMPFVMQAIPINHSKFDTSTAILPLPLIQEEQLSVKDETIYY